MAVIRPFKAIRPKTEYANDVAALPYDVMDSDEAKSMVEGNEHSFLHVDKAEIDFEHEIYIYDKRVYEKARDNLKKLVDDGILIQDEKPYIYIYRLIMDQRVQTGIVACASIDDYINNNIKKHEYTRADKEKDRINHVSYCNANTGPIFLTYKDEHGIDDIITDYTKNKPIYNFVADDGITHMIWAIKEDEIIKDICSLFEKVESLYIADGHHRAYSAVKVGQDRRENLKNYTGDEEFNFFLTVVFPHSNVYIMDYNRVVKDLNGLSVEEFKSKVSGKFELSLYEGKDPYRPTAKHTFGMYLEGKWYKLVAKEETFDAQNPVEELDVSILQNNLLSPVLGIKDPRTDDRIDFIGGIRGLKELERRVSEDMTVAFSMYPTSIEELMDVADAGQVMPPKSTWFEPKPRSGLFIHDLE